MKIRMTFKTPDVVDDAVEDSFNRYPAGDEEDMDQHRSNVCALANKFFKHGEYVTVELDTEAETCTVVPSADA